MSLKQDDHDSSIEVGSVFSSTEPEAMDIRANERFHLLPRERLGVIGTLGGIVGAMSGFYEGIKLSSLRYLVENGHRLPRTVGGWYFYHKKKNYVMILNGCRQGLKTGSKYAAGVTAFFGMEYLFDVYLRNNTIDFLNTTLTGVIMAGLYGRLHQLSRVQSINYIKKGGFLGLSIGITQDLMIWTRGGYTWYLHKLGIKNPRFQKQSESPFKA